MVPVEFSTLRFRMSWQAALVTTAAGLLLGTLAGCGRTDRSTSAISSLLRDLGSSDREVAAAASERLVAVGTEAVPALLRAVREGPERLRSMAIGTLFRINSAKSLFATGLTDLLRDDRATQEARRQAACSLVSLEGIGVATLAGILAQSDESVRTLVFEAMDLNLGFVPSREIMKRLCDALGSVAPAQRVHVMRVMTRSGADAGLAVQPLIDVLEQGESEESWEAACALVRIGGEAVTTRLVSMAVTGHRASTAVFYVFRVLGVRAVPGLWRSLRERDEATRLNALSLLGDVGVSAGDVVDSVVGLARDERPSVRERSCECLGRIGVASANVVGALRHALADPDDGVCLRAVEALGRLAPRGLEAVDALAGSLGDRDVRDTKKEEVLAALGQLGELAVRALPAVDAAAAGGSSQVRAAAEKAGSAIRSHWKPVK